MPNVIKTGYEPRELQAHLHSRLKRFSVLVCHRRMGKTVFAVNEMVDKGLRNQLFNPQYAYFAPYFSQAKRVAWDYVKLFTRDIPGVKVYNQELKVVIPRPWLRDEIKFQLLGADNPESVRGIYLDGGILDEYADMDPRVFSTIIRPALSDREGWALFIGTPKGNNHFKKIYERAKQLDSWFTALYRASDTGILSPEELKDNREIMDEDEYAQEYECSFTAALKGAYYGKHMLDAEIQGRIRSVPHDPAANVNTYWDLGFNDTTVIWFIQKIGPAYHVINHYEEHGKDLAHYVRKLQEFSTEHGYIYGEHVLPHDADAHELGTGKTRVETMKKHGIGRTRVLPRQSVHDGIHATRMILPKCYFDELNCENGIAALQSYEKEYDHKKQVFKDHPLHNWASNSADAFRTFSMGVKRYIDNSNLPRQTESDWDIFDI